MKDRIVHAAEECFVKYGIKGTTMERIAEKMHVSKRTLYEFFPDEASLLRDCLKERMESSLAALRAEIAASGSLESILRINDSVFVFFELPGPAVRREFARSVSVRRALVEEYRKPLADLMKRCLQQAKHDGFISADTDDDKVFVLFETLPVTFPDTETDAGVRYEAFAYAVRTCLAGICTERGRSELNKIINNDRK